MNSVILSIDCGTQSLRAMLFSTHGDLLARARREYEPHVSPRPGWAEQDPEIYWDGLIRTCRALKDGNPDLFGKIAGVGVTSQRATMACVDENGRPLRPAIVWLDQRKAKQVYFPNFLLRFAYALTRMREPLLKIQEESKSAWISQNQPEIWEKAHKYLQVSGFLNFRLTGIFGDSVASQIGHIPFDYKKREWAGPKHLSALLFPIEQEKLPDLFQPGEQIGTVAKEASKRTGIAEGIPVIACGSDKGCETIGMGVLRENFASLSFGTTATVQTTSGKYCEPIRFMPPYPAPIPGRYNPEVEIFRGFWMITWFKNEFAHKEIFEAGKRDVPPEAVLNELLTQAPPGAMGLTVQPYWGPGLKTPSAKGAMIGFGDVHNKAHIYRAVIEGLGYALLDGLKKIEKACKCKVEKAAVSGGASQSGEICQISADIFNIPMVRGKTFETSGLGAAIVTAAGIGIHPSFEQAINKMVRHEKTFKPDPRNAELYQKLFERVYLKIYKQLGPLYEEIRDITGFPEKI